MKHIPIVILNKDRLGPLISLVEALRCRDYTNILIIDNKSSYAPLLNWYKEEECNGNIQIFHNTIGATLFDNGTFYRLACELNVEPFCSIIQNHYVFTDSDVVPHKDVPYDFIEQMISVCDEYAVDKVGLGLRLEDLPISEYTDPIRATEAQYWTNRLFNDTYELYQSVVDTTFAVYAPLAQPKWLGNCIRMGGQFTAHHMPWYYDVNQLPEDEAHYLRNLERNKGPVYSQNLKDDLTGKGIL